jgi:hypothetical protein
MIKKLFTRLIFLSFVAVLLSPFILTRENGSKIMSFEEAKTFDFDLYKERYSLALRQAIRLFDKKTDNNFEDTIKIPAHKEKEILYKWKNEKGEWHYSDAPSEKYPSEEVVVYPNQNVLNFGDLPEKKKNGKINRPEV